MTLQSRVAALEGAARNGMLQIVIHGGLAEIGPDDHARAGGRCWRRGEGEGVETWRARVLAEAASFGAKVLVWGGLPE